MRKLILNAMILVMFISCGKEAEDTGSLANTGTAAISDYSIEEYERYCNVADIPDHLFEECVADKVSFALELMRYDRTDDTARDEIVSIMQTRLSQPVVDVMSVVYINQGN